MNIVTRLGDAAEGSIQPRYDQLERQTEFTERVASGEFLRLVDHLIVCGCIDGRCGGKLRASSAGGTLTPMVMDDLTTKRFAGDDDSTKSALENTIAYLEARNLPVGGHDDEHRDEEKTGCGANDKLPGIYGVLATKAEAIRQLAETLLGTPIDDSIHGSIVRSASERADFSVSTELRDVLAQKDGRVDTLRGEHNEIIICVNNRAGTSLDHQALEDEFGSNYEAFCVDAWALENTAITIAQYPSDALEVQEKVVAAVYYNLATALTLCGPKMPIVVTT